MPAAHGANTQKDYVHDEPEKRKQRLPVLCHLTTQPPASHYPFQITLYLPATTVDRASMLGYTRVSHSATLASGRESPPQTLPSLGRHLQEGPVFSDGGVVHVKGLLSALSRRRAIGGQICSQRLPSVWTPCLLCFSAPAVSVGAEP